VRDGTGEDRTPDETALKRQVVEHAEVAPAFTARDAKPPKPIQWPLEQRHFARRFLGCAHEIDQLHGDASADPAPSFNLRLPLTKETAS